MISARFAGTAALVAGSLTIPTASLFAHMPDHGRQHDLMANHIDFIMNMRSVAGNDCCHDEDALVSIPEKTDADGNYVVTIPAKLVPGLYEDVKVVITPENIITGDQARKICAGHPESTTCTQPDFNILWIDQLSLIQGNPYEWCYWPIPKYSENKTNGLKDVQHAAASPVQRTLVHGASFTPAVSVRYERLPPAKSNHPAEHHP